MATTLFENLVDRASSIPAVSQITDDVYTAPQITDETLRLLAKEGFQSVFNLRGPGEPGFVDESDLCKELGMTYEHIPTNPNTMSEEFVDKLLGKLDSAPKPAVVHCKSMMRAAAMALIHTATRHQLGTEATMQGAATLGFDCSQQPQLKAFVMGYIQKKLWAATALPGISKISDDLYVGPQPTQADLEKLASDGVKSVLNLRSPDEVGQLGLGVLAQEQKLVEGLKMKYVNIPTTAGKKVTDEQLQEISKHMQELPKPLFLHCRTKARSMDINTRMEGNWRYLPSQDNPSPYAVWFNPEEKKSDDSLKPEVKCIPHMPTSTCCYIVSCPNTKECILIDTAIDYTASTGAYKYMHADSLIKYVKDNNLKVKYILETHAHADHLSAAPYLKEKLGGQIGIGKNIAKVHAVFAPMFNVEEAPGEKFFDVLWENDGEFKIGDLTAKILHTPGHTPACISYLIGDAVFTGDTLFHPDIGTARCDFPGGSVDQMWESCQKLLNLPPTTRNFIGHDYPGTRRDFTYELSIAVQKATNKMVKQGTTKEEYIAARTKRDSGLNAPALIIPSIQVNIRGGKLPPPDKTGTSYIKIPINKIGQSS